MVALWGVFSASVLVPRTHERKGRSREKVVGLDRMVNVSARAVTSECCGGDGQERASCVCSTWSYAYTSQLVCRCSARSPERGRHPTPCMEDPSMCSLDSQELRKRSQYIRSWVYGAVSR